MWGGGQYRAYGKTERYQIKLWSKEPKLFDGESLPLDRMTEPGLELLGGGDEPRVPWIEG
jgi:hypothetical protein